MGTIVQLPEPKLRKDLRSISLPLWRYMAMVFFVFSEAERLDFDAIAALDQEPELRTISVSWNNLTF